VVLVAGVVRLAVGQQRVRLVVIRAAELAVAELRPALHFGALTVRALQLLVLYQARLKR